MLVRHALQIAFPVPTLIGSQLLGCLDPVGRQDQPRIHRVDADVVLDHFVGQRLGKHHQCRLRDVVDRLIPKRLCGADRRVVKDDAATALLHAGHDAARQTHRGHHVQLPVVLPFFVGCFHDRFVAAGPGVVDQDIGAAKGFLGRCNQCQGSIDSGDVADHRHGRDAVGLGDAGRLIL